MPRLLDLRCDKCGEELEDFFFMIVPDRIEHFSCGGEFQVLVGTRTRSGSWSDKDAVVVYRRADGTLSYPGRNDRPTPDGCERLVMKSLREVERFEQEHGVRNEAMHFDRGSGRGFDDNFRGARYE